MLIQCSGAPAHRARPSTVRMVVIECSAEQLRKRQRLTRFGPGDLRQRVGRSPERRGRIAGLLLCRYGELAERPQPTHIAVWLHGRQARGYRQGVPKIAFAAFQGSAA